MKKLAIISSYKELCGIASYTSILEKEFKKYFEVDIIRLDTRILRSDKKNIIKMANAHIDEISNLVKNYDYINIQFESSLFGSIPELVTNRVLKIIKNCKNLIFTFHSINLNSEKINKRKLLSKSIISEIKSYRNHKRLVNIYYSIINCIKDIDKKEGRNMSIMVHTPDSRKEIELTFEFNKVFDYPLSMLSKEEREILISEQDIIDFKKKYNFEQKDKILGIFGFVSAYKGHMVAIKALELLPKEYKLIIFGSQHPASLKNGQKIDPYLGKLLEEINKSKILGQTNDEKMGRIKFAGSVNDDEYMEAIRCCDYIILPYVEVGQMASAVATQVLEAKSRGIFSNTKTFFELEKYYPDSFEKIDVGNYFELAEKILNYKKDHTQQLIKNLNKYNLENNILNYKRIFEL